MISQYFTPCSARLLIVQNRLRRRFARFNLRAHLLDLRRLLVELSGELRNRGFEVFLLLRQRRL